MIRIDHLQLPAGLSALARRDANGDLAIIVSAALEPGQQRAAVRVVLRTARRHGWRRGLLPLPLAAAAAAARSWLRELARLLRAHSVATTAIASVVATVAAAAVLTTMPPGQDHVTALQPGRPATGARPQPAAHRPSGTSRPGALGPSKGRPGTAPAAGPSPGPGTGPASPAPSTAPAPGPVPTPSAVPAPSPSSAPPSPSPSPTGGGSGGGCLHLLIVKVCL